MVAQFTDRDLVDRMVSYPSEGVTVTAFVVGPKPAGRYPAIVIVQEWWGLNEHMKDVARRYAREGYVAVVPDLYSRLGHKVTADPNEAGKLMQALEQADGLKDLNATLTYLRKVEGVDASRIGVTGFCMGGSYALMLPCTTPDIKAAAPFYGQVPNPDTPLKNLAAPILYIYGEEDGWITKADVQRLREALRKYNKAGEIKTYPGAPHAFFNDTRKDVYRPAAAEDAWKRVLAFFRQHLQA
jgi:carboxymethylenebutenolidase